MRGLRAEPWVAQPGSHRARPSDTLFRRESGIWVLFTCVTPQMIAQEASKNDRMTVNVGLWNRGSSDRSYGWGRWVNDVAVRSVSRRSVSDLGCFRFFPFADLCRG